MKKFYHNLLIMAGIAAIASALGTIFSAFSQNASAMDDTFIGEWIITQDVYKSSDLATKLVQGPEVCIDRYGEQYVVEVEGQFAGLPPGGFTPAVMRDGVLYVWNADKGGMQPIILNGVGNRLFYFAEFKRIE